MLLFFSCIAHQVYFLPVQGMLLWTERGYVCPSSPLAAAKLLWVGREPGSLGVRALCISKKLSQSGKCGKSKPQHFVSMGSPSVPLCIEQAISLSGQEAWKGVKNWRDKWSNNQLCRHIHMTYLRRKEAVNKNETKNRGYFPAWICLFPYLSISIFQSIEVFLGLGFWLVGWGFWGCFFFFEVVCGVLVFCWAFFCQL